MRRIRIALALIGLAVVGVAVGCRANVSDTGNVGGAGSATSTGAGTMATNGIGATSTSTFGVGSTGTGQTETTPLYVSTDTELYTFDLEDPTSPPLLIGAFDCIGTDTGMDTSMNDVAVNAAGEVWGVSGHHAYRLELPPSGAGAVHCTSQIDLTTPDTVRFYALTFAPAGVLDPTKEILVAGNSAGELWVIDDAGGASVHGNFGNVPANDGNGHAYPGAHVGKRFELSGDIVFLANGGSPVGFATVRDCPNPPFTTGCSATDTLIQIDVAAIGNATTNSVTLAVRGQIVPKPECPSGIGFGSMYGIAAVGTEVFGFSRQGFIVAIDNVSGAACQIQTTPDDKWAGAGVTTLADVTAPPPK